MTDLIAFDPPAKVISASELDGLYSLLQQVRGLVELLESGNPDLWVKQFAPRTGLELIQEKAEAAEKLLEALREARP